MNEEKITFKRKLHEMNGSLYLNVPSEVGEYLGIKKGDEIIVMPDSGKHGRFTSFWKKE